MRKREPGLCAALFWQKEVLLQASLRCSYPEGQAEMVGHSPTSSGQDASLDLSQESLEGLSVVTPCSYDICPDHRASLPCGFTFLHYGGPPDLTMETSLALTRAQMTVRQGAPVGFIHSHGLKPPWMMVSE